MLIRDWSSDVCSSDLRHRPRKRAHLRARYHRENKPVVQQGGGKAEIEAEQRGRGFGLSENPFGEFAAGPDLSRRWNDVRRRIAFAAEGSEEGRVGEGCVVTLSYRW